MEKTLQIFQRHFSSETEPLHVFAPYCLCPLGAHVDHQHGKVLGMALDKGIDFLFTPTDNGQVELLSTTFAGKVMLNVGASGFRREYNWGDYLRGALWAIGQQHSLSRGLRGIISGAIPSGGIGSSAALLCGFIAAIAKANKLFIRPQEIVELASKAERQYVGLDNGVLDQSCVALSRAGQLLFLDTHTSRHQLIPFPTTQPADLPFSIAIFYSGVTRSLTATDYNQRVSECRTAASILQAYESDDSCPETNILRNTSKAVYEQYVGVMPPRYARRARHFFTECARVEQGVEAWRQGDIVRFGQLMFESCESSIANYECGSRELIALYHSLRHADGVYGARFCGAGFIGSCFALIDPAKEEAIRTQVISDYVQQFPMYKDSLRTFVCQTSGGLE